MHDNLLLFQDCSYAYLQPSKHPIVIAGTRKRRIAPLSERNVLATPTSDTIAVICSASTSGDSSQCALMSEFNS